MHYGWCYTFLTTWQLPGSNSWGNSVFGVSLCTTPFCQIIINYCFCSKQALSNVSAVFGSFIAIFIADRVGRRDTLLIFASCYYLFIICASRHQSTGSEFGVFLVFLYIGWLLTGIGAGWTSVVVLVSLHSKATFCIYPSQEQLVYIVHDMKEFTLR